jgi:hypothetical protein
VFAYVAVSFNMHMLAHVIDREARQVWIPFC